jgi:putative ATP-dependent endonuclease of OLD family
MRILSVEIQNYRNLSGQKVVLHNDCNFIVGENNLGKSNLLNFINVVFTQRGFNSDDFKDLSLPISGKITLQLEDVEKGIFSDLFDAEDPNKINIILEQPNPTENLEFKHEESLTFIQPSLIRCLNYVHYDSLRNPISEINFDKGKGVGRFLTRLVKNYVSAQNDTALPKKEYINEAEIESLIGNLNTTIEKLKAFNDFGIKAGIESDLESLLPKMVSLVDINGDSLTKSGYGVQFLILVTLSILDKIQTIVEQKWRKNTIFEGEEDIDGSIKPVKYISLVLGLDEPEIHLHPYMQRSLVKYLNKVISNQNQDFNDLLKSLFGIDKFIGQIIIITHSPNIILNDYKQIIRLYKDAGKVVLKSGSLLTLIPQEENYLNILFPAIKEAFFSRSSLLVEGETEFTALPKIALKYGIDFDELGIALIKVGGDAISIVMNILNKFGINCVGVQDFDKGKKARQNQNPNLYFTNKVNFEDEIVDLVAQNREYILRDIFLNVEIKYGIDTIIQGGSMMEINNKFQLGLTNLGNTKLSDLFQTYPITTEELNLLKCYYLSWFSNRKGFIVGRIIGEKLPFECIPEVYENCIKRVKELSILE